MISIMDKKTSVVQCDERRRADETTARRAIEMASSGNSMNSLKKSSAKTKGCKGEFLPRLQRGEWNCFRHALFSSRSLPGSRL